MKLDDLRISTRLAIGFGAMALLLVLLGSSCLYKLREVEDGYATVVGDRYQEIAVLHAVKGDVALISRAMANMLLMAEPAQVREQLEQLLAARARVGAAVKGLEAGADDPGARQSLAAVVEARSRFVVQQDRFVALVAAGRRADARKLMYGEARPVQLDYFAKVDALIAAQQGLMNEAAARANDAIATMRLLVWGVGLATMGIAVALALWTIRSISALVARALGISRAVAAGDLSVRIEQGGRNELGQLLAALRRMQDSLASVVSNVRQNAELVATASTEISQGNNDLSSRTEEQATALQQTAASMKQLAATVRQNADSARQGSALAVDASAVASRGGAVVDQVVETMKGINESSRRIADITGVIDGIAFQTNILALNAAVEAARAGEQGRGFAVVATEVRNLAQRSADAAQEIQALVAESVARVEQGSTLVDQAGATMREVVGAIVRVTDLMGEISAASNEQSLGVGQIGEAVQQMDQATQQNAALVEQSAAAAGSLKAQAQQLVEAVAVFRLQAGDAAMALAAPPAAPAANAPTVLRPEFRPPQPAAPVPRLPAPPAARTGTDDDDWQTF